MLRITHQMIHYNSLGHIQQRQNELFQAQAQISSGYRFDKPSQDPVATGISLDLSKAIAFHERMTSNATVARDFNQQADHELGSAADILQRVRELAVRSANEVLNELQLQGISSELDGLLESLADIGNATHEGNYVFGGYQSDRPPFQLEKNLVLEGTALTELGLNAGTFRTQVETRSLTTVPAGSFSLNGGDLIINGVDIGSFHVIDPSRSDEENAQALVERINAQTERTGVTARAVTYPSGTYALPGSGPLNAVALVNLNTANQPSGRPIQVAGRGVPGVGGMNIFRHEEMTLADTRFTTTQIGVGAIGDVPAGTFTINGLSPAVAMNFAPANTSEQNAQEIARVINTLSAQTEVFAETDGNGFVMLRSPRPFTLAGVPPQLNLPNQLYEQQRNAPVVNAPVTSGGALTLLRGSLILNGIDIFSQPLHLDTSLTVAQRAARVAAAINRFTPETGIQAMADASGQLHFSNADRKITDVTYLGDTGENLAQIGRQELLPLYMSGDQAFSGQRNQTRLVSGIDLPAAGLGSAVSVANVSFAAGDTLGPGELVINGHSVLVPGPLTGGAAADAATVVAAINAQSGITGVSAQVSGVAGIELLSLTGSPLLLQTSGNGLKTQIPAGPVGVRYLNAIQAGDLLINGVDIGPVPTVPANPANPLQNISDLADALVTAINAQADLSGVSAEKIVSSTGTTRILLTATAQDIRIESNNPVATTIFNAIGLQPGTVVRQKINAFEALIRFRDQVLNGKFSRDVVETISIQNLREVDDAFTALTGNRVELGVRGQRAELLENRGAETREVLTRQLADQREIDLTEAISRMTLQETALQAAYNITQRMAGLSLLNYL